MFFYNHSNIPFSTSYLRKNVRAKNHKTVNEEIWVYHYRIFRVEVHTKRQFGSWNTKVLYCAYE